jgi:tetratricopeptide (TPR) repeat protein
LPFAQNILRAMDVDGRAGLKSAPDVLLARACARTHGNPRALEALFAILSSDPHTSLKELLADPSKLLPDNLVEALVSEAFSRLEPGEQKVVQALAIYGRPVTPAAVDYLLQPFLTGFSSASVLKRLMKTQFVRSEKDRYYLNPVDQGHALERVPLGNESDRTLDPPPFSRFGLLHRAAEYFKQARTPSETWKKLEDLTPQLAEFELRFEAREYEVSALLALDFDNFLLERGYYSLVAGLYQRLLGRLTDRSLELAILNKLGFATFWMGDLDKARGFYENAVAAAQKQNDRASRASRAYALIGLGACYAETGETLRAIDSFGEALAIDQVDTNLSNEEYDLDNLATQYCLLGESARGIECYRKALAISRELSDRRGESRHLHNLALELTEIDQLQEAIELATNAVEIATEIKNSALSSAANQTLALARFYNGEFQASRFAVEAAVRFDEPTQNHCALALLGAIALRQKDLPRAHEAFRKAVAMADILLSLSAKNFTALDVKGFALCGLTLSGGGNNVAAAIDAYSAARRIAQNAGLIRRELHLFDALSESDQQGVLATVRIAVMGK